MSARAAYPNAAIYPHGALTATQLEQLCHDHRLRLMQTTHGYLYLSTESTAAPKALPVLLPVGDVEGAAAGPPLEAA